MDRIATISLPARASRVSELLAAIVSANPEERLYVAARSDGLAVYSDSWRNNLPRGEKAALK